MKNINSVMGFNKYNQLHEAAVLLLNEKKAAKLENEKQRQEYEKLVHQKQGREAELKQLREDYDQALDYSEERREQYNQLKQGRNADEMTRDRIKKQKESISKVEKKATDYRESGHQRCGHHVHLVYRAAQLHGTPPEGGRRNRTAVHLCSGCGKRRHFRWYHTPDFH